MDTALRGTPPRGGPWPPGGSPRPPTALTCPQQWPRTGPAGPLLSTDALAIGRIPTDSGQGGPVNRDLRAHLTGHGGVGDWADLSQRFGRRSVAWATRQGDLRRLFPRTYIDGSRTAEVGVRLRAALTYAGEPSALYGPTALLLWGLLEDPERTTEPIHVAAPPACRRRSAPGVVVHRVLRSPTDHRRIRVRQGLPVTDLESSVVASWELLGEHERRAAVIGALRRRLFTPQRLHDALADRPQLRERSRLRLLIDAVASGGHCELELWGNDRIFSHRSLPACDRQYRVAASQRVAYLDVAYPAVLLAAEMDSITWHGSPQALQRDQDRDNLLAELGWQVLRFSWQRLRSSPTAVRNRVLTVHGARARLLGGATGRDGPGTNVHPGTGQAVISVRGWTSPDRFALSAHRGRLTAAALRWVRRSCRVARAETPCACCAAPAAPASG